MHALIIEDEPLIALELADALHRMGYDSCSLATTEHDAVTSAETRPPDLVVADVRLRVGNGIEAVQAIRRRVKVPVVFATASREEVRRQFGRASILDKPFVEADLKRAVDQLANSSDPGQPLIA